jgi:ABC-type transporter Mla subunit MlaD
MKLVDVTKCIAIVAAAFMCFAIGLAGIEARQSLLGLQSLEESTQTVVQHADKAVTDTSSMVNANLIHLDLIMGRAEVLSRSQEAYWKMVSTKTETTLDNANTVLANLADTTKHLDSHVSDVSQAVVATLNQVQPALQETTKTIQSANNLIADPSIKQTLQNINQGTSQIAGITKDTHDMTSDLKDKVHHILHPTWAQRALGWVETAAKNAVLFFK